MVNWPSICRSASLSWRRPLLPELSPEADETPLVVESVLMVEAALEPSGSWLLANGRSELCISAIAFWW